MRWAALAVALLLLSGCSATLTLGDREVPVEWVGRPCDPLLLRLMESWDSGPAAHVERVVLIDTPVIPGTPLWVGRYSGGTITLAHGTGSRTWRHELNHARLEEATGDLDPDHSDPSWEGLMP